MTQKPHDHLFEKLGRWLCIYTQENTKNPKRQVSSGNQQNTFSLEYICLNFFLRVHHNIMAQHRNPMAVYLKSRCDLIYFHSILICSQYAGKWLENNNSGEKIPKATPLPTNMANILENKYVVGTGHVGKLFILIVSWVSMISIQA